MLRFLGLAIANRAVDRGETTSGRGAGKAGDGDFLRSVAEAVVQLLMATGVERLIGAGHHERSGDRTAYRDSYRDQTLDTWLGSLQLRILKLRQGSYFAPFLKPRNTLEKALVNAGKQTPRPV